MPRVVTFLTSALGGGGAQRVTVSLANYLAAAGFRVNVVVSNDKRDFYQLDKRIRVCYLPSNRVHLFQFFVRLKALKAILKDQNPDYFISLGWFHYHLPGGLSRRYRCIVSERNSPESHGRLERWLIKACFRRAERVVFQTEEAMRFYGESLRSKSVIIPNPLKEDLPEAYFGARKRTVVTFGRLAPQKNIPMLLRSFAEFSKDHPDYCLQIFGEGSEKERLVSIADSLGISDKTNFFPFRKEIHEAILDAGMYVSSSDYEGISNSMLEAMAIGLPVICTDCPAGGSRMYIRDHENGLLIPVGDDDSLTKAMCYFADHPEEATRMGRQAASVRGELAVEKIGEQWAALMP